MTDTARYLPSLVYLVPSLLVALYALRGSPPHSNVLPAPADRGLDSLPPNSRVREIYPENWLEGGGYVTLPLGRVKYWIVGPENGKKVVLIHGLTTPALAFARIVPLLVAANFRVMVYDLYGRGYSDAPRTAPYDTNMYVTQLALLLQHVGWDRTRLVGYSMGGAIAAAFVATFPNLVEKDVGLIASAGAGEKGIPLTSYRHFALARWIVFQGFLRRITKGRSTAVELPPASEIAPLQAASLPGYSRAVASSLHEGPIVRMRWAFRSRNWKGRRVMFIFGTNDTVVKPVDVTTLRATLKEYADPDVRVVDVAGAGHDVVVTHAPLLAAALVEFFEDKVKYV
ncbi:Hydrolase-4 domain-containing protein [Mycena chlorophos]|uniref:Hydrolase-4 domain-containing protein n=1 Tax=Mycena chlorophos TaxID=658473 RepID=A0A8H6SBX8_MYCCL|nr:Hydrolase-4 domain-containing protein [Mycena chlorophos]